MKLNRRCFFPYVVEARLLTDSNENSELRGCLRVGQYSTRDLWSTLVVSSGAYLEELAIVMIKPITDKQSNVLLLRKNGMQITVRTTLGWPHNNDIFMHRGKYYCVAVNAAGNEFFSYRVNRLIATCPSNLSGSYCHGVLNVDIFSLKRNYLHQGLNLMRQHMFFECAQYDFDDVAVQRIDDVQFDDIVFCAMPDVPVKLIKKGMAGKK